MPKAILINPQESPRVVQYSGLDELTRLVGGYVEVLRITDSTIAYINDNGKLINLPYNPRATRFCQGLQVGLAPWDPIVGPMVLVGCLSPSGEMDGDDYDVPEDMLDYFGLR